MNEIDYKELLTKYIQHVEYREGEIYTSPYYKDDTLFTDDEWKEIESLGNVALRRKRGLGIGRR